LVVEFGGQRLLIGQARGGLVRLDAAGPADVSGADADEGEG
jgi:hypothetical protein